jgi:hypothetical protein
MTDSELLVRVEDAFGQIIEAIEARGGLVELDKKPDFRWSGVARLPAGKLLIHLRKTGKQAAPESKKQVAEAIADLTLEGRFIASVLFFAENSEIEFPGGGRKPLDHSSIIKMVSSV